MISISLLDLRALSKYDTIMTMRCCSHHSMDLYIKSLPNTLSSCDFGGDLCANTGLKIGCPFYKDFIYICDFFILLTSNCCDYFTLMDKVIVLH